jgi:hypothetical protein
MKFIYKTIRIESSKDLDNLNNLYDEGWEFVDSVAQIISSAGGGGAASIGYIYFTLRKQK